MYEQRLLLIFNHWSIMQYCLMAANEKLPLKVIWVNIISLYLIRVNLNAEGKKVKYLEEIIKRRVELKMVWQQAKWEIKALEGMNVSTKH